MENSYKEKAQQIAVEALQLYEDNSNEWEWRLSLESDILSRFKYSVTWYVFRIIKNLVTHNSNTSAKVTTAGVDYGDPMSKWPSMRRDDSE